MLVRPEAFARNGNHVRLMQQTVGNIDARLQTPTAKICRDVGINVEGTHWSRTTNSRDLSQIGEYLVAQANVICAELGDAILRTYLVSIAYLVVR